MVTMHQTISWAEEVIFQQIKYLCKVIQERKILRIEYTTIILLWTLAIMAPLLFIDNLDQDWMAVHIIWAEGAVIGLAFLINRFVLMPRLFFAKLYAQYITSLAILFLLLALFVLYFDGVNLILSLFSEHPQTAIAPPMMGGAPPHEGMPPHGAMPPHAIPIKTLIPPMIKLLILSAIVIALDMGLSIAAKWVITEQKQAAINRERVMAQLSNLQSQVSPHFFMNTLNNIHALVDIDSERAKETIIELSSLMNYLLYDSSNQETVSLQREMEFINSYVNLMRLRFAKHVKIEFSYDQDIPSIKVPPLLFLNFIENAFKYGVDYEHDSFVRIRFHFSDSTIEMTTLNSNHSAISKSKRHGLGISNSRKRLDLIYDNRYSLNISEKETIYYVNLRVPIR